MAFDLILQRGTSLLKCNNLPLLLVHGSLQHDPLPLSVSAFFFEVIHFLSKIVVGFLDNVQSAAEALILSYTGLNLQVLLSELHLELAHCLLAVLYLVFHSESLLGQLIDFLFERHLDQSHIFDVDVLCLQFSIQLEDVVVLLRLKVFDRPDFGLEAFVLGAELSFMLLLHLELVLERRYPCD